MKIGFIICGAVVSPGGGVRLQGLMWYEGLKALGHTCDLINPWDANDWKKYDALIVLQAAGIFPDLMPVLYKHNQNIFVAPIIDPNMSLRKFCVLSHIHFNLFGLNVAHANRRVLYNGCKYGKYFLTRSNEETLFLSKSCDLSLDRIFQVPLSLRFNPLDQMPLKEDFCLHVSRLRAKNKNVEGLIQAAKKYNFKLVLAGMLHGEADEIWLDNLIRDSPNIQYIGAVSDEVLKQYYKKAKVFALPSFVEGVGMVALEAAGYGCEIVLTQIGAPKEYWDGQAELVNPYSIDEIGQAVVKLIKYGKSQPKLLKYISEKYSPQACSKMLENVLLKSL